MQLELDLQKPVAFQKTQKAKGQKNRQEDKRKKKKACSWN